jgi:hypothetical protein
MTRWCNVLGDSVGAVKSSQTDPRGPVSPNKQSKLLVGGIVTRQRGTESENAKKEPNSGSLVLILYRWVQFNNNEPLLVVAVPILVYRQLVIVLEPQTSD